MKHLKGMITYFLALVLLTGVGCADNKTALESSNTLSQNSTTEPVNVQEETASYVRLPLKKGVNLTCWEMDEWRPREYLVEEKYYHELSKQGFDHVRIPVNFSLYATSADVDPIPKDFLAKVDRAVKLAFKYNLYVILDMHGCGDINNNADVWKQQLFAQWKQLANHYKDYDEKLIFELLNEPSDGGNKGVSPLNGERLNEIMNETIRVIREIDKERVLVAAVSPTNMVYGMDTVTLPSNDKNIIVAVHSYEPIEFTHQGATWSSQIDDKNPREWKEEYKEVISDVISRAATYQEVSGRQVCLGEFGVCLDVAHEDDVAQYLKFITDECEKNQIGWCYWEFWMSFGIYDRNNECWKQYVLDALIN